MSSRVLSICVDDIKFDPEDELTPKFNKDSVHYYVYLNTDMIGQSSKQNNFKNILVQLSAKALNDASTVLRITARDHGLTQESGEFVQIGTISINCEQYFKSFPEQNFGSSFVQWITLFDDAEDDEFDGEIAEDDEELPMVRATLIVEKSQIPKGTKAMVSPRRVTEKTGLPISPIPMKKPPVPTRATIAVPTLQGLQNLQNLQSPKGV